MRATHTLTHQHTHTPLLCLTSANESWERDNKSRLDKHKKSSLHFIDFVTFTDSRYKNYKWPTSVQVHRSQRAAPTYKRQMFVKYTSRRNATDSTAKPTAVLGVYSTVLRWTASLSYRSTGIFAINYNLRIYNHTSNKRTEFICVFHSGLMPLQSFVTGNPSRRRKKWTSSTFQRDCTVQETWKSLPV